MEWKPFLIDVSNTLQNGGDLLDKFKLENENNWLGFDGVSIHDIQFHEARLNTSLPHSYKEFLKISNGFKQLSCFIWDILSVDKIDWLKAFDPFFHDLYAYEYKSAFTPSNEEYFVYGEDQRTVDFRSEYLTKCLAISCWGDSAILLLNPEVKYGNEWEAWMFANWYPGAVRYKSFELLMQEEYSNYVQLVKDRI